MHATPLFLALLLITFLIGRLDAAGHASRPRTPDSSYSDLTDSTGSELSATAMEMLYDEWEESIRSEEGFSALSLIAGSLAGGSLTQDTFIFSTFQTMYGNDDGVLKPKAHGILHRLNRECKDKRHGGVFPGHFPCRPARDLSRPLPSISNLQKQHHDSTTQAIRMAWIHVRSHTDVRRRLNEAKAAKGSPKEKEVVWETAIEILLKISSAWEDLSNLLIPLPDDYAEWKLSDVKSAIDKRVGLLHDLFLVSQTFYPDSPTINLIERKFAVICHLAQWFALHQRNIHGNPPLIQRIYENLGGDESPNFFIWTTDDIKHNLHGTFVASFERSSLEMRSSPPSRMRSKILSSLSELRKIILGKDSKTWGHWEVASRAAGHLRKYSRPTTLKNAKGRFVFNPSRLRHSTKWEDAV